MNNDFYKSKEWRQCRNSYFIYKHGICERCGELGKIVHHKIYINKNNIIDPEVTLNFSNLILLCQDSRTKSIFNA
ncbi:HNH endonuclease [Sedimentibacter sp. zth1]|nr:HNH endonuclease [Sedimentibacter sp. zth1]